mmetsp:Transcript_705/g.1511  ORF Transcript_705/g.1511 Transcript_705/m.1511 type:complete len:286 (-) Transcript_705:339-1196(-)
MITFGNSIDFDIKLVIVQVSEFVAESSQGIHQRNLHSHIQMIPIPVIMFILLLRDNEIQITRIHPRLLVGHALKRDGLPGFHSLLNINRQLYLLGLGLPIRTFFTVRTPHLPGGDTPFVTLLHLLNEPGCDLLHPDLDSRSLTLLVVSHTFLPVDTERLSDVFHLDDFAEVQLFHCHAEGNIDVGRRLFPLLASSAPTSESEVAKDIVESAVSTALSLSLFVLLQPLLSVTIVDLLLLLVGQDLVGVGDLGKLVGGTLRLVFIGVKFEGFGTVCFLDFLGGCRAF